MGVISFNNNNGILYLLILPVDNPESFEVLLKKDEALDIHLKDVYVKSHDPEIRRSEQSTRALPLNRRIVEENEFGFLEPINITIGRCTLRQAVR